MEQVLLGAISQGLLWAVMTLGVYITYRVLGIADMTAEGSLTLGAAVAAGTIAGGGNAYAGVAIAVFAGALAGLATGLLHTKLRIPALLSGILTMIALYSINLRIMGAANIPMLRKITVFTSVQELLGISKTLSVILMGALCSIALVSLLYWFFGTEIGSAIRATGTNPHMVRAQGINTDTTIIIGLMISNALISFSGSLISQAQNFADLQMGTGAIVIGLASLIIGEVLFGQRHFYKRLLSMVLGAITYRIIIALVLKMGMPSDDLKLFTAITVALALSLPRFRELRRTFMKSLQKEGAR